MSIADKPSDPQSVCLNVNGWEEAPSLVELVGDWSTLNLGSVVVLQPSDGPPFKRITTNTSEAGQIACLTVKSEGPRGVLVETHRICNESTRTLLVEHLAGIARESEIHYVVEAIIEKIPVTRIFRESHLMQDPIGRCSAVVQRLDLIKSLASDHVQRELFWHWQPLIVYLCLTCFDLLGQSADYIAFPDWIRSKRCVEERIGVADNLNNEAAASALHSKYLGIYGMTTAFNRFLDSIAPQSSVDQLMDSIRIETYQLGNRSASFELGGVLKKRKFLLQTRNSYTHSAHWRGGFGPASFPSRLRPMDTWTHLYQETSPSRVENVLVKEWPTAVISTVRAGLWAFLQKSAASD